MSDIPSWSIIDDTSSFLFYSGYWQDQSVPYPDQQTPALDPYYNRTYHTTTGDQNYIKFSWLGSGISVYGTKRANHGIYSIILDADSGTASREYLDGYSSDEAINSTLYTKDLAYGTHEIYIINESYRTNIKDRNTLGLDAIIIYGSPLPWDGSASSQAQASSSASSSSADPQVTVLAAQTVSQPVPSPTSITSSSALSPPNTRPNTQLVASEVAGASSGSSPRRGIRTIPMTMVSALILGCLALRA